MATNVTTERNRQVVERLLKALFERRDPVEASAFFKEDYIRHDPRARTGRRAFLEFFQQGAGRRAVNGTIDVKRLIAEGDFVVAHFHLFPEGSERGSANADIFRLEDGQVAEQWGVMEAMPEQSANQNGTV